MTDDAKKPEDQFHYIITIDKMYADPEGGVHSQRFCGVMSDAEVHSAEFQARFLDVVDNFPPNPQTVGMRPATAQEAANGMNARAQDEAIKGALEDMLNEAGYTPEPEPTKGKMN